MAKQSVLQRNYKRIVLSKRKTSVRSELRKMVKDLSLSVGDRFLAQLKLAKMPRDSSVIRVRNRCLVSGRPRGVYRRFKLSRIELRSLCLCGQIPGLVKSSW